MGMERAARAAALALVAGGLTAACSSGSGSENARSCDITAVANKVLPSVVTISATNGPTRSTGSGEVLGDGNILTNNHVVSLAANGGAIAVLFSNGSTAPGSIKGRDPLTDLAVVHVDTTSELHPITLGSSSSVEIGEPVVVLGAPLGLTSTVTAGIRSALNRTVEVAGDNGQTAVLLSAVQTDAAINPGNSGGALTDCTGDLIGVPSATASVPTPDGGGSVGSIGLGFAIPVDLAKAVSDELLASGS